MGDTTLDRLIAQFGTPLLTSEMVAKLLSRSPEGLRISLMRGAEGSELATKLNAGKVRLGRRVYYKAENVAALLDGK